MNNDILLNKLTCNNTVLLNWVLKQMRKEVSFKCGYRRFSEVYLIAVGSGGLFKIGCSNDSTRRIKEINSEIPCSYLHLYYTAITEYAESFEKYCHTYYRTRHLFREFFDFSDIKGGEKSFISILKNPFDRFMSMVSTDKIDSVKTKIRGWL